MQEQFLLEINRLYKGFNGNLVLKGVDFKLKPGEIYSLVGGNGAGKSTLVKIITGYYQADQGELIVKGEKVHFSSTSDAHKYGIYLVPQEPMIFPNMTVEENITIGMPGTKKELKKRILTIMKKVGWNLKVNRMGASLSIAEQQLVEILRGLVRDVQILILDEPTSTLTNNEISTLFEVLKQLSVEGIGIIYITHRLNEIFEISNSVSVLRDGIIASNGDISTFTYERLLDGLTQRESKNREQRGLSDEEQHLGLVRNYSNNTKAIMKIMNISSSKFKDISFCLFQGEILGITGVVGAGRTELAEAIMGLVPYISGTIEIEGETIPRDKMSIKKMMKKGLAYVPEDRHLNGIFKIASINDNTISAILDRFKSVFIQSKEESKITNQYVHNLNIKSQNIKQEIRELSGGNQQKVVLAKFLATKPKIIILDEPTRGIDANARKDIYKIIENIKQLGTAIIIISSDVEEIVELSNRVIVMHEGTIEKILEENNMTVNNITSASFGVKEGVKS